MVEPIGKRIQDLNRLATENIKRTKLVKDINIHIGDIKNSSQPIRISYEITGDLRNFLVEFTKLTKPLEKIFTTEYTSVLEIKCNPANQNKYVQQEYHESFESNPEQEQENPYKTNPSLRVIELRLESKNVREPAKFKYNLINMINNATENYLKLRRINPARIKRNEKTGKKELI